MVKTIIWIVLLAVLLALIATSLIFIIKNFASPKKISGIQNLIKQGKYQQAQKACKSLIAKNQRDYVAHYLLGKSYMADKKPELAFMEFKTVNQNAIFNGDIPELEFRKQMAELYTRFNQPNEALKEFLLLTKLEPSNAEHCYNTARLYEQQNKLGLALGFYQKAVTCNKKHAKAHAALGYLLFRSKQFQDAKNEISLAINLSPETYSNYYYLGKIYKESKDLSAAVKAFEKAQRDPEIRQKALIERGSCLMLAGQSDQAINDFDRAVKCAKDENAQETLYARYFLAACYEKTRHIEKALEQWEMIFQRNKQFKDVGQKLNQYKDLQANDSMKEYLTSGNTQFMEMCKKIAAAGLSLSCQKCEPTPYGCTMLATEEKKDSWMNVRQQILLVDFYRDTEPLEDGVVRKIVDTVKAQGYVKGIIITSSSFTHSAISFAESRPVTLFQKEHLEKMMSKAKL